MKRGKEIKVRFSDEELESLQSKVSASGYSRERYIRTVLNGSIPKEKPPIDYYQLINEFNRIGVNLNQLVKLSRYDSVKNDAIAAIDELRAAISDFDKLIRVPTK